MMTTSTLQCSPQRTIRTCASSPAAPNIPPAPLAVTTGGGHESWSSFCVDCDELGDLLDSAAHQPQAICINLSLTGDACLDCYDEGWLANLAQLAETSVADLREELGQLSRFTSHRVVVGKQQAVKFLFCLPAEVLE